MEALTFFFIDLGVTVPQLLEVLLSILGLGLLLLYLAKRLFLYTFELQGPEFY